MKITSASGLVSDLTMTLADDEGAPVVVILPAFGTPAGYYRHLTPTLAANGLACVVVEYPGRDTASGVGRHTTYGYDALATEVHEAVMTAVRAWRPGAPVVLLGHSLGGHVALFAAALHASDDDRAAGFAPDGLVLATTASPYWRGYGRVGSVRAFFGTGFMALIARGVGYWPGDRLRFWGRQSRELVVDWSRIARTGRIRPSGARVDYEAALAAYDGDVLALSVPQDDFAPVPALERLLALVPQARVTRWHAGHDLGHITWVRDNTDVVPVIVAWVQDVTAGASAGVR